MTRPGERDDSHSGVPYDESHKVRYVFEVMGFDTPEYEERKEKTHSRMRCLGHVCRLEAKQFDSRHFGLECQCAKLIRQIRKDLLRQWYPDGGGI